MVTNEKNTFMTKENRISKQKIWQLWQNGHWFYGSCHNENDLLEQTQWNLNTTNAS